MSRPQEVHRVLPGREVTVGMEEDEDREDGERQSSSNRSSGPEEPTLLETEGNMFSDHQRILRYIQAHTDVLVHRSWDRCFTLLDVSS